MHFRRAPPSLPRYECCQQARWDGIWPEKLIESRPYADAAVRSRNNTPGGLVAVRQRSRQENLAISMTMLAHVHANETDKPEYGQKDRNQAKNSERLPSPAAPGAIGGAGHVAGKARTDAACGPNGRARSDEERIHQRSHKCVEEPAPFSYWHRLRIYRPHRMLKDARVFCMCSMSSSHVSSSPPFFTAHACL